MKWNIVSVAMKGTTHMQNGEKCQDYIGRSLSNDFAYITLADGAGAVKYATEGAVTAAEETKRQLETLGESLFSMDVGEIRGWLLTNLREKFMEECRNRQCTMKDLSTTLAFFATNGREYVAANIGDGLVGRIATDGQQEVILDQDQGAFVNECHFITDTDCEQSLHIKKGRHEPGSVYFLLSDGSCECLYNDRKKTFSPALHVFSDWMWRFSHHAVSKAIITKMSQLFPLRTDDDCAITLLSVSSEPVQVNDD